jgi:hypothetical protein
MLTDFLISIAADADDAYAKKSAKKGPGEVDRRGLAASFSPGGSIKAAAPTIGDGCGNLTSNRHKNPPVKQHCHFRAIAT